MNKQPNILVFMTDSQNADTIKPWHQAKTPNVDAFLHNAVHFEPAYTASPHCCPARVTFSSGLYPSEHGVWNKKWKYVLNTFDYDELYDLENDPEEMYNLAKQEEYKPIIKEMCKKLWQFAKDKGDNCTCPYIMVSLAPYGPGILLEDL